MEQGSSLCVGCGLCCDGTLFSHLAALGEDDLGLPLRLLGVRLIVEADPPAFALPCPAVADGRCTVYDRHRPRACHEFNCDLVHAVEAGTLTPAAAREVIAATRTLRDRVRAGDAPAAALDAEVEAHFLRSRRAAVPGSRRTGR
jgi:uncharacterized protein